MSHQRNPSTVSVPTFDELLWPTLKALKAMGGSGSKEELLAKLIELERIPEPVASFIHTDNRQTKVGYKLAWAKTYLKRAGESLQLFLAGGRIRAWR